jgi:hypothetical protein
MPNPHPKVPKVINLASLARVHTVSCIRVLAGYASNSDVSQVPPAVRIQAIGMLLDRGWGRASPGHTDGGGESIEVTIRHIIEDTRGRIIDATPVDAEGS